MPPSQNPDAFSRLLHAKNLPALYQRVFRMQAKLEAMNATNLAVLLEDALIQYRTRLTEIARDIAKRAPAVIREQEAATRVRPDTQGDGGKRLEDYLGESAPLTSVPGSVGLNFEPPLYQNVPWWWTNEEGYSGHVGRVVHGYFYDAGFVGRSRPDVLNYREHPLFRAEGPQRPEFAKRQLDDKGEAVHHPEEKAAKGVRPGMLIKNPIPPRRFVRDATRELEVIWHAEIAKARAEFFKKVDRITLRAQAHAQAAPAKLPRTPRRSK